MTMISNSSFEQQLDNSLSVSHNLLQRIDPQINEIAINCKKDDQMGKEEMQIRDHSFRHFP
jgi:hypothetical protein